MPRYDGQLEMLFLSHRFHACGGSKDSASVRVYRIFKHPLSPNGTLSAAQRHRQSLDSSRKPRFFCRILPLAASDFPPASFRHKGASSRGARASRIDAITAILRAFCLGRKRRAAGDSRCIKTDSLRQRGHRPGHRARPIQRRTACGARSSAESKIAARSCRQSRRNRSGISSRPFMGGETPDARRSLQIPRPANCFSG